MLKKKKEYLNILNLSSEEIKELKESDWGDKLEIMLYGQKLEKLYINAAINMFDIKTYNKSISEHMKEFLDNNKPCGTINLESRINKLPLLNKLMDMIKKYSKNKRMYRLSLDGNTCLQISSCAIQDPGDVFLEFKSLNFREYMGTS